MSGVVKVVTDSTEEPITRLEAKTWLRIEEQEVGEDDLIDGLIALARARIEELTQRSFLVKTFDYYLDEAPDNTCPIVIPKAPLVTISSIKGFASTDLTDTTGTAMSSSGYYVDTAHEFGRVAPAGTFSFPTATRAINPVIIRFTAGYSTSTTGVPDTAKTEIKQLVAKLYEHRGDELELREALAAYDASPDLELPTWG